jgi:hypothetical protein
MKPRSSKKAFLKLIANANRHLDTLEPAEGVELMLAFYRDERAAGCPIDADGDMLLFQWGTYDWGEGDHSTSISPGSLFLVMVMTRTFFSCLLHLGFSQRWHSDSLLMATVGVALLKRLRRFVCLSIRHHRIPL